MNRKELMEMETVFLGEVIKSRRKELGLTQEQLCEGICEPITLSRLENGKQVPSFNRMKAIMERLDLPTKRAYVLLSQQEQEVNRTIDDILAEIARFRAAPPSERGMLRKSILKMHQHLEKIVDRDDCLSRQFLIFSGIVIGKESGPYTPTERKCMAMAGVHLTHAKFNFDKFEDSLAAGVYNENELRLMNTYCVGLVGEGNHVRAVEILRAMLNYYKTHIRKNSDSIWLVTSALFNYANELNGLGQYSNALAAAEEGCKLCKESGRLYSLPKILVAKAEALFFLGKKEESLEIYTQAYYMMKAMSDNNYAEQTHAEIFRNFQISL